MTSQHLSRHWTPLLAKGLTAAYESWSLPHVFVVLIGLRLVTEVSCGSLHIWSQPCMAPCHRKNKPLILGSSCIHMFCLANRSIELWFLIWENHGNNIFFKLSNETIITSVNNLTLTPELFWDMAQKSWANIVQHILQHHLRLGRRVCCGRPWSEPKWCLITFNNTMITH